MNEFNKHLTVRTFALVLLLFFVGCGDSSADQSDIAYGEYYYFPSAEWSRCSYSKKAVIIETWNTKDAKQLAVQIMANGQSEFFHSYYDRLIDAQMDKGNLLESDKPISLDGFDSIMAVYVDETYRNRIHHLVVVNVGDNTIMVEYIVPASDASEAGMMAFFKSFKPIIASAVTRTESKSEAYKCNVLTLNDAFP